MCHETMGLLRRDGYRWAEPVIFETIISNIKTALHGNFLREDQSKVTVQAVNNVSVLSSRQRPWIRIWGRGRNGGVKIYELWVLRKVVHRNKSARGYLHLCYTANYVLLKDIRKKRFDRKFLNLRGGQKRCTVIVIVVAEFWSGKLVTKSKGY